MTTPRRPARSVAFALLALLLVATTAVPATAAQPPTPRAGSPAPSVDGVPGRQFPVTPDDAYGGVLFGALAAVARQPAATRLLEGLAHRNGEDGREVAVAIDVSNDVVLDAIRALGGRIVNRSDRQAEAYVAPAALAALAGIPGVNRVTPIVPKRTDAVISAGVHVQGADGWQAAGFTGAGVKIGIIDAGFDGIIGLLGTELPATVHARCFTAVGSFTTKLEDCQNGFDHGTGVAETALDMAPGVSLYIADPISYGDDRSVISWMTSQGVRIINASFASGAMFEGPGDGTAPLPGSIYEDITQAAAGGALWVNSAGNHGDTGWTGAWTDVDGNGFGEFADGDESNTLHMIGGENISVAIRWAEPWGSAKANYNVAIYEAGGVDPLEVGSPIATGVPQRFFTFRAPVTGDYDIAIVRLAGAATSRMQLLVGSEHSFSLSHKVKAGTLPSPADSKSSAMVSVGAADVVTPTQIEDFSSQGPTVDNRIKPDITGADCGQTAVFGEFCGTSASAPHVTGGAALVLQANPSFTSQQIIAFLKARATPIGSPAPNNQAGVGLMNLGTVPPPPPGAPKAVVFKVQPVGAAATKPLATQPVVNVVDANGTTVPSGPGGTADVTLALTSGPSGATLTCKDGLTTAAVAGVATFTGCTVSEQGSFTILATSSGLTSATSQPFTMGPPPPPIPLVFTASPADGAANTPLTPTVVVKVQDPTDPAGGPITTGDGSAAPVTLALGNNPSSASLFCSGGLTRPAVAGMATFTGCRISAAGSGYTLVATSPGLVQGASQPFNQSDAVAGATLSLMTSATAIVWGTGVALVAHLDAPSGSAASAAGRAVHLQSSKDGVAWATVMDLTTSATGDAATTYRPVTNLYYRVVFDGAADLGGGVSAQRRVTVRETIALRPDNGGAVKVVRKGTTITFTATVRPARPDVPPGKVTVQLYRRSGSTWRLIQTITSQPNSVGSARFAIDFGLLTASYRLRAMALPTAVNANSLWTPYVRFDVK